LEWIWIAAIIALVCIVALERRCKNLEARLHGIPETVGRLNQYITELEERVDKLEFELSCKK
jgi:uncharacterized coiled-coil protein SlyX